MTPFCCSVVLRANTRPALPFQPMSGPYSGQPGDTVIGSVGTSRQYVPTRGRSYRIHSIGTNPVDALPVDEFLGTEDPAPLHNRLRAVLSTKLDSCSLVCIEQIQPSVFVHVSSLELELNLIGVSSTDADLFVLTTASTESVRSALHTAISDPIVVCLHSSPRLSITLHPKRLVSRWYRLTQEKKDRLLKFAAISRSVLA